MTAAAPGERFFFVHLQKTAGTSLLGRLRRHFGRPAIYPAEGDGEGVERVISVENLQAVWRARGDEIRVVTGHFPLCTAELLGGGFTTLTVLRDPVERTLSYLRHHRKTTPGAEELSLEDVYEDSFRFHGLVHNHMVKMFSLTVDEMDAGALTRVRFDRERLERAKANLEGVDAVGLQEEFEDFCGELSRRFGWRLGRPVHANQTKDVPVPQSFRDRIAEENADDVELYEHARALVAARRGDRAQSNRIGSYGT